MIVVLTGGTGGAKFIQGLKEVVPASEITAIVNTGDDLRWWGLHVSPDLDSITYALAGVLSEERGWGVEGDTFYCLKAMQQSGAPTWFQLGDRDLATHIFRTQLLAEGKTLTAATAIIASSLGIAAQILPMTDARVETRVMTPVGELGFQEYFVRERYQVQVDAVRFDGAAGALPAPGVIEAINTAEIVFVAPSNPVTSIGPILAVPGIREALRKTPAPIGAISPIVGGAAVSGPAAELMRVQGLPASIEGVAKAYLDFLDVLIIDQRDADDERNAGNVANIEKMGIRCHPAQTIMKTAADKATLALAAIEALRGTRRTRAAGR
jgi:LPPG:FO 2-phospho-L-lactate transferase